MPTLSSKAPGPAHAVPRARLVVSSLALLLTLGSVLKPLTIDDAAYQYYARQIASHPLDPYGFAVFWYDAPMPANYVLAPPVLLYWWGLARAVVGEHVWLWKLSLFPWALLLVWSCRALLLRFAPRHALPFLIALLLSPALLPSLNYMLDVPALALTLAAVEVFARAADRGSPSRAVLAGLAAGLAMQTKYTGLLGAAAVLLYGLLFGRVRLALAASLVAAQVFVTWELLVALLYGESHFLIALRTGVGVSWQNLLLLPFLSSHVGALACLTFVMGLAALGARSWALGAAFLLVLGGHLAILLLDAGFVSSVRPSPALFGPLPFSQEKIQLAEVLFNLFFLLGLIVVLLAAHRLLTWRPGTGAADGGERRQSLFLLLWLAGEVAGYLVLTPFPAARRVLGVVVVLTLLLARLAGLAGLDEVRALWLRGLACAAAALGIGYAALDLAGASLYREAASTAAAWIQERGPGRVWFAGHWGFQYYAEQAGFHAVVPEYDGEDGRISFPPPSRLRPGDWLILPDDRTAQQALDYQEDALQLEGLLAFALPVPVRTVPCFYGGRTPVEHVEGPAFELRVFRVTGAFTPEISPPRPAGRSGLPPPR